MDSVENGDFSILRQLNISFTEFNDGSCDQKITFKFNGVRYTVNIISNTSEDANKTDEGADEGTDDDVFDLTGKTMDELSTLREEYQNKLDEVEAEIRSLSVPMPPYPNDYKLQDGSLDEQAYNEAMQDYNNENAKYNQQIKELNRITVDISYKLQTLDAKIAEMKLEEKTSKLQEEIDALKDSPNANPDLIDALEKQLEFVVKATGTNSSAEKTMLLQQQADVRLALLNLDVPVAPNTTDFIRSDGTVDEEAYSEALNKYEFDSYNYDQHKQDLEEKLSIINNELSKIELEEKDKSTDFDKLEKNIDVAKNIQERLDNISNNSRNRWLIANLKSMLTELASNVGNQTRVMEYISALQEEMKNTEVPTPPSASEYQKVEYSFMDGSYKYTIINYEQMSDGTYMAKLSDNSFLMCKLQFDENGYITKLTPLDKYGNDVSDIQVTMESVVDEDAYSRAFEKYEAELRDYDRKMNEINRKGVSASNELSMLQNQLNTLNFSSCAMVLGNKIKECRHNGDYRDARILERKLRDLSNEFSNIKQEKNKLLNRQRTLTNRLNSLVPPTPPSTNDYLNADGSVNERAYKRAFERYEKQNRRFDEITARINEKLGFVQDSLNQLNEREAAIQSEIEELTK